MSALAAASKLIVRHSDLFIERCVLFSGDLDDFLPVQFSAAKVRVHTNQYNYWQLLNQVMGDHAKFGLTVDAALVAECDTLIYFWPKNKQEALFQLCNILALLRIGSDIFIVGENCSGVRSAAQSVACYTELTKIDSAFCCGLYHGFLSIQATFDLSDWWKSYQLDNLEVKTLPGVFSYNGLDAGTALLLSTIKKNIKGSIVLDLGCGAGVIGVFLAKILPSIKLILSDVSASALRSSYETMEANDIKAEVIVSDVYSNITGCFDMIISNPPFHNGTSISLNVAKNMIREALKYLVIGGRLRIVANTFLPYQKILNTTFGNYEVLAQNSRFKVYQATVWKRPSKYKIKNKI